MLEREFIPTEHANLSDNFERIQNNMAPKTRANYSKKFKNIIERITKKANSPTKVTYTNLLKELECIEEKRQAGLLKRPSMRQYKASILYGFTMCYEFMKDGNTDTVEHDNEHNQVFADLAHSLSAYDLNKLYARVGRWGSEDSDIAKELDNMAHLKGNTSSRKAKLFDEELLKALLANTEPRLHLLQTFLQVNMVLGLRPNEWYSCEVVTSKNMEEIQAEQKSVFDGLMTANSINNTFIKQSLVFLELPYPGIKESMLKPSDEALVLVVKNSKDSHGRANGSYRYILLDRMDQSRLQQVNLLIELLRQKNIEVAKERGLEADADCFDSYVMQPLQHQLRYELETNPMCQRIIDSNYKKKLASYTHEKTRALKLGKDWSRTSPIRMYPTLYSTRHQAVSNAKASNMNPVLMAALFGHASIVTAERHYGKQSDGWGGSMVEPHPDSIASVINGLTESQISNCLALASTTELAAALAEIQPASTEGMSESQQGGELDVSGGVSALVSGDNNIHVKLSNAINSVVSNGSGRKGAENQRRQKAARKPAARKK